MKNRRAFIVGIKTTKLTNKEISFLRKYKPWGVILFNRNIRSIDQVSKLTKNIRKIFSDNKYPILIDEEGGQVTRLKDIIDLSFFNAKFFGDLYIKNKKDFFLTSSIYVLNISSILKRCGINLNTVPVLDVRRKKTSAVIGDRAYNNSHIVVKNIGSEFIKQFHKNKIGTVIKHIPGHGLAKVDSHKKTPIVYQKKKILSKIDFYPFKKQNSFFAMTAHIIYKKFDNIVGTHSKKIINIIRKQIKFRGLIITDDISMKGLKFSIKDNTIKAFSAGCNIVLHCNGKMSEMLTVAKNSPNLSKFIKKKTSEFYKILR